MKEAWVRGYLLLGFIPKLGIKRRSGDKINLPLKQRSESVRILTPSERGHGLELRFTLQILAEYKL